MIKAIGFLSPLEWLVENFSFKKTEDSYPGSSDPGEFFDRFTCVDNVEGLNVPTYLPLFLLGSVTVSQMLMQRGRPAYFLPFNSVID